MMNITITTKCIVHFSIYQITISIPKGGGGGGGGFYSQGRGGGQIVKG